MRKKSSSRFLMLNRKGKFFGKRLGYLNNRSNFNYYDKNKLRVTMVSDC